MSHHPFFCPCHFVLGLLKNEEELVAAGGAFVGNAVEPGHGTEVLGTFPCAAREIRVAENQVPGHGGASLLFQSREGWGPGSGTWFTGSRSGVV